MLQHTGGFLHPEQILQQLHLRPNMNAADFGCGHGYFSLPLAKMLSEGRVYSLDVMKEALQAVKSQAEIEGISNIETIRCNLEEPGGSQLPDESMDVVILANILFQSNKKPAIIKEAARVLRKEGQCVLIDWLKEASLSPQGGWLISKKEAQELAEAEGLTFERDLQMDNQHYGMVFRK